MKPNRVMTLRSSWLDAERVACARFTVARCTQKQTKQMFGRLTFGLFNHSSVARHRTSSQSGEMSSVQQIAAFDSVPSA